MGFETPPMPSPKETAGAERKNFNEVEEQEQIKRSTEKGKIFLTFGQKTDEKKYKEDFRIPVTEQPTIGYNTFDTRKYKKGDQWMRERHLGNKVVEIIRK